MRFSVVSCQHRVVVVVGVHVGRTRGVANIVGLLLIVPVEDTSEAGIEVVPNGGLRVERILEGSGPALELAILVMDANTAHGHRAGHARDGRVRRARGKVRPIEVVDQVCCACLLESGLL